MYRRNHAAASVTAGSYPLVAYFIASLSVAEHMLGFGADLPSIDFITT